MDIQLSDIIEKIKEEGLEKARKEEERIIAEATQEAERLVDEAKKKAATILSKTEKEASQLTEEAEKGMKNAARTFLVEVEQNILRMGQNILDEALNQALKPDSLTSILSEALKEWSKVVDTPTLFLPEGQLKAIKSALYVSLDEKIRASITIQPSSSINQGFRLSVDKGRSYLDFSSKAISDFLMPHLSGRIQGLLRKD